MGEDTYEELLDAFNAFLGKLPHKYKIFVAGNHESRLPFHTKEDIAKRLSNCTYLQDSAVVIEGTKFYGSPWTHTRKGFTGSADHIRGMWERIPEDTDVLITHSPPHDVLDLAWDPNGWNEREHEPCRVCKRSHQEFLHWGCRDLRQRVFKIRPKMHLFGHVHDDTGVKVIDNVLFSNAAMDLHRQPVVIDYRYEPRSTGADRDEKKEKTKQGGTKAERRRTSESSFSTPADIIDSAASITVSARGHPASASAATTTTGTSVSDRLSQIKLST